MCGIESPEAPYPTKMHLLLWGADKPRILLINSGKADRYWDNIAEIRKVIPNLEGIPEYYRDNTEKFKTWFKVLSFEPAPKNIMSPYFITEYKPD